MMYEQCKSFLQFYSSEIKGWVSGVCPHTGCECLCVFVCVFLCECVRVCVITEGFVVRGWVGCRECVLFMFVRVN